jgi:Tripartite tricarboxylate transporter family receptor
MSRGSVVGLAKPLKIHEFEQRQRTCLSVSKSHEENAMHLARLASTLGMVLAPSMTHAQNAWPSRSITFIVPYAAGGYTDLVGRMTAHYVESALGKTVVVEDRPGAGGIVGTQAVANAAPDGYTFCVCSIGAVSIAPFAQKVGYDRAGGHRQQGPAGEYDE